MNSLYPINHDFIEIKDSTVHGKGLFAKKDIPAGTLICIIEGEFIDEDECVRREEHENNNYIFWHSDTNYIDVSKNYLRFLNHDCDPKCWIDDGSETTLNMYASVDISAGEELTIDYEYDEIYDYCNSSLCRERKNLAV
jgi:SET domain-containing protein